MALTREKLFDFLGELPQNTGTIRAKHVLSEEYPDFVLERLVLDLNGYEPVPAIFARPKTGNAAYPAVLFNHSHGNLFHLGKMELINGCEYMLKRGYAHDLAKAGIASLAIDHMCFEERNGRTQSSLYKQLLWEGCYMWSWMIFDSLRALDYLCMREDVDETRIATLGMSMGSAMTQWVAALDTRIKACVDICCLTNFDELAAEKRYDQHGIYYYIPGMRKAFTTAQLNALIAPRAHFSIVGRDDPHTPLRGVDRDEMELRAVYDSMGAQDKWKLQRYPVGHMETEEMRFDAIEFLKKHL